MIWIKGAKGSLVNLDRIMSIVTDFNESTQKYDVKAFYDCVHCNDLAYFEHIEHAIDYVDRILKLLQERKCTLETADSEPCSKSDAGNSNSFGQAISSLKTALQLNSELVPTKSGDSSGTQNQT
jgi:hypothetical protein